MTHAAIYVNQPEKVGMRWAYDKLAKVGAELVSDGYSVNVSCSALEEDASEEEYFDEYTLFKVVNAFKEAGIPDEDAHRAIEIMQNLGILFRERVQDKASQE